MKHRLLFLLFACVSISQISGNYYVMESDFKEMKEAGNRMYVINNQQVLSPKEEYSLNAKFDSIYENTGVDINIAIYKNGAPLYRTETTDKLASNIRDYWKNKTSDSCMVIIYFQHTGNLGFYLDKALQKSRLDSTLIDIKEELFQQKSVNKKQFITHKELLDRLIPEIDKFVSKKISKAQEIKEQVQAKDESQRAEQRPVDIALSALLAAMTMICLVLWCFRKGRIARERYADISESQQYLTNKNFRISLFFLFLYPIVAILCIVIIALSIKSKINMFHYTYQVILAFMFLGWIPSSILIQIEKSRLGTVRSSLAQHDNSQITQSRIRTQRREEKNTNTLSPVQRTTRSTLPSRQTRQENEMLKININTATLQSLRNRFAVLTITNASLIIQEREKNGDFKSPKNLQERINLPIKLIEIISREVDFTPSGNLGTEATPRRRSVDF